MSKTLKRMVFESIQDIFVTYKEDGPLKDLISLILPLQTKVSLVDDLSVSSCPSCFKMALHPRELTEGSVLQ